MWQSRGVRITQVSKQRNQTEVYLEIVPGKIKGFQDVIKGSRENREGEFTRYNKLKTKMTMDNDKKRMEFSLEWVMDSFIRLKLKMRMSS